MNIQEASITKEKEALIEDFFKPEAKRYIFGINKYGDKLFDEFKNKNLKVEAFIDDFTPNKIHKNTKIIKLQSIEEGYVIVVVTCNTNEAIEKIKKENVKRGGKIKFIDYFAFQKHSKLDLVELEFCDNFINPKPSNFSHFRDDFSKNRNEYENIYNSLADEKSKKYFENIINFRLTQDYKYMESFHSKLKEQYFEDFLDIKNIDYFFDIGAYRGETSKEFISRNRNYKNIYVFEPDSNNILEARKNLKEYKNIEFFNIAIGDKKKTMYLKDNKDKTALHLLDSNEDNTTKIQLDSIDNVIENIEQKSKMGGEYDS